MMNRKQENDYQAMKQRLVTICEVQAGTISATEAAERLGVSRKTFYEYMSSGRNHFRHRSGGTSRRLPQNVLRVYGCVCESRGRGSDSR